LIPQGGGDHYQNHRCPGEWIAIEQMKAATDVLVNRCSYEIPEQDLQIAIDRLPAIPADHFAMTNIQLLREVR
jgi:fatty-acid peroxygenase